MSPPGSASGTTTSRAVNAAIVYGSLSGYGQTGPLALVPGHDLNYQAFAGAIATRAGGPPPSIPILPVADLAGATTLAFEIAAAWAQRLRPAKGSTARRVDDRRGRALARSALRHARRRAGRRHRSHRPAEADDTDRVSASPGSAGYGAFQCADGGWITLAVISEDHFWDAVCDALGLVALRSIPYASRLGRVEELNRRARRTRSRRGRATTCSRRCSPPARPSRRSSRRRRPRPGSASGAPPRAPVPAVDEHRDAPWG